MKLHRDPTERESHHAANNLYKALAAIRTAEEAKQFLQDLCTPTEIQALSDRWRVVEPIVLGKPYRQIYEETGVSVTTIGRVARCMLLGEGGYQLIYERIKGKYRSIKPSSSRKK